MLADEVVAFQASALQKSHDDMIQRDALCAGRSHAAWPFIVDTVRIQRVRGPGLIATVGCHCYDRLADGE